MRALALLLCLLSTQAWAATWYVRPAADCTNNGDGTAYACAASGGAAGAWSKMSNVVWGVSGVNAGDTLKTCAGQSSPFTTADYDGGGLAMLDVGQSSITIDGDCSASGGSSVAYMTGSGSRDWGIYCADATVCPSQTWKNISLTQFDVRGFYVRNALTTTNTADFVGTNLSCTDIIGTEGNLPQCVSGYGNRATLTNITSTRSTDDAVHWEGDNFKIIDSTLTYPGYQVSTNLGDCVQIATKADNARVQRVTCDHRNGVTKACFIFGDPATGNAAFVYDSTCLFPASGNSTNSTKTIYSVVPNTRFVGNYISGGYYGLYMQGANQIATGNVVIGQEFRGIDAVSSVASGTSYVVNNSAFNSANCYNLNGQAGVTVLTYNNLAMGCSVGYTKGGSGATITQSNNAAYSNTSDTSGSFGSIAVTSNPLLSGGDAPASDSDFCLKPTSPLLAAGTYIGAYATGYGGEDLGKPPVIGARGLCNIRRAVSSRRAVSERRAP